MVHVVFQVVVVLVVVLLWFEVLKEPLMLATPGRPTMPAPALAAAAELEAGEDFAAEALGSTHTLTPDWLLLFSVVSAFAALPFINDMIMTVDSTTAVTIEPNMTAPNITIWFCCVAEACKLISLYSLSLAEKFI